MRKKKFHRSGLVALTLGVGGPARAAQSEVGEFRVALQYGIGYLPLAIMKHNQLIEKHLGSAGLARPK